MRRRIHEARGEVRAPEDRNELREARAATRSGGLSNGETKGEKVKNLTRAGVLSQETRPGTVPEIP